MPNETQCLLDGFLAFYPSVCFPVLFCVAQLSSLQAPDLLSLADRNSTCPVSHVKDINCIFHIII